MKKIFTLLLVFITSAAFAQQSPLRVSKGADPMFPRQYQVINLVAADNDVVIQKAFINRGSADCPVHGAGDTNFPRKLRFGENMRLKTYSHCNIIEIGVATNKGGFTYQF